MTKKLTLRQARAKRNLSQEQLEERSGIDQSLISKIELGKIVDPSNSTVMALAAALDIDPRVLVFGVTEIESVHSS